MTHPFTIILVPNENAVEVANDLGPKYHYDLKREDMDRHPAVPYGTGDRIRTRSRWGTVVGFGYQPLGEHVVVRFDKAPKDRESFVLFDEVDEWETMLAEDI